MKFNGTLLRSMDTVVLRRAAYRNPQQVRELTRCYDIISWGSF